MKTPKKASGATFFIVDLVNLVVEGAIYFVTLCPFVLLWNVMAEMHLLLRVGALLCCLPLMAILFVSIVAGMKKALIGEAPAGRLFINGKKALRWILADRFVKMIIRSPFFSLLSEFSFLRFLLYRSLGARIDSTLLMGRGACFPEPWAVTAGKHVHIGDHAVVSGHKVERDIVTLGTVEIGDGALIGAGAVVFPKVVIGEKAVVGANSVVAPGTTIPAGEIWAGVPARPLSSALFSTSPSSTKDGATSSLKVA